MQYRTAGKTGERVSALGFGTMRLPVIGGETASIDQAEAIRMIRHAIDAGVNYIDTALFYHDGNSETLCGKALEDGYREKVFLADKFPPFPGVAESPAECDDVLNRQLEKCQTDSFDFYLVHCIIKNNWPTVKRLELARWLDTIREQGRVKHVGFSFHDNFELFREVMDYYDWSFCQLQYNFMNENHQAGSAGVQYAAERGLGVIVMEPLLGGALAHPPGPVQAMWDASPYEPVDTAFRWLYDKPEVSLVLSGMSNFAQVEENLEIAGRAAVGSLVSEEKAFVDAVVAKTEELTPIPCTRCNYCMPCPNGVNIPVNFAAYNLNHVYPENFAHRTLHGLQSPEQQASNCIACGACEEKCPQNIPIIEWMQRIAKEFG